ncbi:hypothetical protein L486_00054 [Kwoniella mangroviensis CBS 10435]|uniref:Glycine-rich protein n=1 Tax=Kwoniella mangroviensis CBS 10435 TaxID=1331196 RepID=A0A1B9IY11_9TREE|nr:uncharacterized protein I203_00738 [Kwoniella mangroviensis CBS 8507]OCF60421.1 hypothetical protein L486_00054 [Kwoniella mangroviensis CBS 10435]OCF70603.1 hypothetical protein I203_00738 [Kwoniella mangroviensis CBS 8507]OCF74829.1 hypothetical protein I204_05211 [Kwoniella mangroviensis CBS 8886]
MFSSKITFFAVLSLASMVLGAPVASPDGGSAYTGVGGQASGGSVQRISEGGLLNLDILNIGSDNAGSGGSADSGSALGGAGGAGCTLGDLLSGGNGGSAYTGAGGQANGGNVVEQSYGGLINLHALNIGSGNAGNGGSANSGSAAGGNSGCFL